MCILPELDLILGALPAAALCQIYTPSNLLTVATSSLLNKQKQNYLFRSDETFLRHATTTTATSPHSSPFPGARSRSPERDRARICVQSCCPWVCVYSRFERGADVLTLACLFVLFHFYLFILSQHTGACQGARRLQLSTCFTVFAEDSCHKADQLNFLVQPVKLEEIRFIESWSESESLNNLFSSFFKSSLVST